MIPIEIQEFSQRVRGHTKRGSDEGRRANLDIIDELRKDARIHSEALKRRVERQHKTKLFPKQFKVSDLVLRRSQPYQMENKLSPKWSGPYRIREVVGNGAYRLETLDGGVIPRTWNASSLKFYFS